MATRSLRFGTMAALLMAIALPAAGQNRALLSIGIDDYESERLYDLQYAVNDARRVAQSFEQAGYRSRVLINVGRTDILKTLFDIRKSGEEFDSFVLYVTGIGLEDELGQSYFVPADADPSELQINGVRTQELLEFVSAIPARVKTIIMDYPLVGFDQKEYLSLSRNFLGISQSKGIQSDSGQLVIFTPDIVYEFADLEGSTLAAAVINAVTSRDADFNGDGVLDMEEFATYVPGAAERLAARHGQKDQTRVWWPQPGSGELLRFADELQRDDQVIAQQLRDLHQGTLQSWESRGWISLMTKLFASLLLDRWASYGGDLSDDETSLIAEIRNVMEGDLPEQEKAIVLEKMFSSDLGTMLTEIQSTPDVRIELFRNSAVVGQSPRIRVRVPEGYKIVGGGASIGNSDKVENLLTASYPYDDRSWVASTAVRDEYSNAKITAYALAIYDPADAFDVRIFKAQSEGMEGGATVSVTVPGNYRMTGGGAGVESGDPLQWKYLVASYPQDYSSWTVNFESREPGNDAPVSAYAIGLRARNGAPLPEIIIKAESSRRAGDPLMQLDVDEGYVLTGGGAAIGDASSRHLLTGSFPATPTSWIAAGQDRGIWGRGVVTAYAIAIRTPYRQK